MHQCLIFPDNTNTVRVVVNSRAVKRESHFKAMVRSKSIAAIEPAFCQYMTKDGKLVCAPPAPPALPRQPLSHPFISTTLRDGVWVPMEYLQ